MHTPYLLKKSISILALVFLILVLLPSASIRAAYQANSLADVAPESVVAEPVVAGSITPSSSANHASTPVVILGSGFTADSTISLGTTILSTTFVSSTELNANVPWGLSPGVYDLSISDPAQPVPAVLPNAFTVTLGLGKWINNGPFGGQVLDLVYQPGSPARIFACVLNAGLFVSTDGAASWTMLINASFPMRLMLSPADPQVLYVNTNRNIILRSRDGGASWTELQINTYNFGGTLAAFPHPNAANTVYIAASPNLNNYNEGGSGELWISTDYGNTLTPLANAGLTDKRITELAFDPADTTHQTLLAGTISGKIFQSANAGASWAQKADLAQVTDQSPARIDRLVFNPTGAKEPWVVKRNPFLGTDLPVLYRGSADRSTWTGQTVVDNPTGPHPWYWMRPWSLTISADKIWVPYDTGYTSPNDLSLTWSALNPAGLPNENWRGFEFTSFVIDPANTNTVYAGTRQHGVYKSTDGGQTWAAANQGLAGVNPYALAVSPDNLDEVYSVSQTDGVAKSSDGGRHWTALNFMRMGAPWTQTSLVVDPHDPRVVYLGMWCPQSRPQPATASDACVRISRDRGATWTDVILPQPPPANFESGVVFAIAVDPQHPGRVLAGATFFPYDWSQNVEHPFGAIYYSDNYGATWTRSNVDANLMKGSYRITYDDSNVNLVYAGTDGSGLWKSADGGVTWNRISWTGCADTGEPNTSVSVQALATKPNVSGELFASCEVTVNEQFRTGGLYHSTNAGQTWTAIQSPQGGVSSLLFLRSAEGLALYAGGWRGAARSLDGGQTWTTIDGLPAGAIYTLAGWADDSRAVVYFSTEAGMGTGSTQSGLTAAVQIQASNQTVMAGGTYGLTQRLNNQFIYLPSINRAP